MNVGISKGVKVVGIGNGSVFGACFLTYSLGFLYSVKLIRESIESGYSGNECVTGGDVIAVFSPSSWEASRWGSSLHR
jgi:hypothetical protein